MYQVSLIPYYDAVYQCYKQILTIYPQPSGGLAGITKQVAPPRLSPFRQNSWCSSYPQCFYAILNPQVPCDFLSVNELPLLIDFLSKEGYKIDNQLTKVMMKANSEIKETLLFYIIEIKNH